MHDVLTGHFQIHITMTFEMRSVFIVFGLPLMRPGETEFLAVYSSHESAQLFVDAQDDDVKPQLTIAEVVVDQHPEDGGFWKIP